MKLTKRAKIWLLVVLGMVLWCAIPNLGSGPTDVGVLRGGITRQCPKCGHLYYKDENYCKYDGMSIKQ